MRITNKIMQSNQLYNINQNKIKEDKYSTQMATNKKINRASEDPVVAIRALRLRSNVAELTQYYDKNSKDAESWLKVTEDSLSTVTELLTSAIALANKGANKDLTTTDLSAIIKEMSELSSEYYSTGNVDYGGRYVFTGYRTDTPLTFMDKTSQMYTDIRDGFNAADIDQLSHISGVAMINAGASGSITEAGITEQTMGRIRLSYDKLDETIEKDVTKITYKPETDAGLSEEQAHVALDGRLISVMIKDPDGVVHEVYIKGMYTAGVTYDSETDEYTYTGKHVEGLDDSGHAYGTTDWYSVSFKLNDDGTVTQADVSEIENITTEDETPADRFVLKYREKFDIPAASVVTSQYESGKPESIKVTFTDGGMKTTIQIPELIETVTEEQDLGEYDGFKLHANSDGTFRLTKSIDGTNPLKTQVINLSQNGSIFSSYCEISLSMESEYISSTTSAEAADEIYKKVYATYDKIPADTDERVWINTDTGELMLSEALKNKLSSLPNIQNADTIEVIYDKSQWEKGNVRPENLFECYSSNNSGRKIHYNGGTYGHTMSYDVGYSQTIDVNTQASDVFVTDVGRALDDLNNALYKLETLETTMAQLKANIETESDATRKMGLEKEYTAAEKAQSYLRENLQKQLEHKITEMQRALDVANLAVTENGTRSRRLDLIQNRLQSQVTTFKTLQSENEDIDMAETATNLVTAQTIYNAALQATGKISQTSLMDYI